MDEKTFGEQLRAARKKAGFSTLTAFADALSREGVALSDDALGHWEGNRRQPPNREALFAVIGLIGKQGGFDSAADVNRLLYALSWRDLDSAEIERHFSSLTTPHIANLPTLTDYHALVGREAVIEQVIASLLDSRDASLVVVSGLGRIGKTAVAYEAVRRVMLTGRFERLAWESAKSEVFEGIAIHPKGQKVEWVTLLASLAHQLDIAVPSHASEETLKSKLKPVLQANRYLIVLDNLETLEAARDVARQFYELLTPSSGDQFSRILLTSRERLVKFSYVIDHYLKGLAELDSLQLLKNEAKRRYAEEIVSADAALLKRVHEVTGGMPLALILIVTQSLLGIGLERELDKLQGVVDEQKLYEFIYFDLWQKLSPGGQQLLVGAAAYPMPALQRYLIAASRIQATDFEPILRELVRCSLMDVLHGVNGGLPRYTIHPMTRWFVNAPLAELWQHQYPNLQHPTVQ